jgi:hypothetical protein
MSYELTLQIVDDSPQEQNIEAVVAAERISREAAAMRLLGEAARPARANGAARRILGAFESPEDAAVMDHAVQIALAERERRNSSDP